MLEFKDIVKDSYRHVNMFSYPCVPFDTDIAEDIADNYLEYKNVDLSTPEKYTQWVNKVDEELDNLGLKYRREE